MERTRMNNGDQDIFAAGEAKIEQMRLRTDFSRFSDVWARASGGGKVRELIMRSRLLHILLNSETSLYTYRVVRGSWRWNGSGRTRFAPSRTRWTGPSPIHRAALRIAARAIALTET